MKKGVEAIIIKKEADEFKFLVLKRLSGNWQFLTGMIEEGEKSLEALKREIKEEISIEKIERIVKAPVDDKFSIGDEDFLFYVYIVKIASNVKVNIENQNPKEHSEFAWVSGEECLKILRYPNQHNIIKKVLEFLKGESTVKHIFNNNSI